MSERKYKVRYKVEPASDTEKDLRKGQWGGCDRLFLTSVVDHSEGGVSYVPYGFDPREPNATMGADEIFKVWAMLAQHLSETLPDGGRRMLCDEVFCRIQQAMRQARDTGVPVT